MKALILFAVLFSSSLYASYFEFYGTGAFSSALGNQATLNNADPGNHYYHPALMAWNKHLTFSAHAATVTSEFDAINGIIVKNDTNSDSTESGNANTEYGTSYHSIIHATLPIAYPGAGPLSFSFVSPFGDLAETNSGDARLPEYVMYHSRHKRTQVFISYAHPLNETWGFALGSHIGFQASADAGTQASLNGAGYGSSAEVKSKISPALAAVVSVARRHEGGQMAFTFQQEMKSNLRAGAVGEVNNPTSALFDITLDSMIYYDPHIFRLSYSQRLNHSFEVTATGEYQLWGNYKPPTIFIKRNGGVLLPSDDYEKIKIKDIPVARVGLAWHIIEDFSLSAGAFWRPSPLDGNFEQSGNSIDSDVIGFSGGFSHSMKLFEKEVEWGASLQYHMLEDKKVTKSANQEDGSAGSKIGAPGYSVGGHVLTGSLGARMMF